MGDEGTRIETSPMTLALSSQLLPAGEEATDPEAAFPRISRNFLMIVPGQGEKDKNDVAWLNKYWYGNMHKAGEREGTMGRKFVSTEADPGLIPRAQ